MKSRSIELFLSDIIEATKRIQEYTTSMNLDSFKKNNLVVDAVIRNLEIIGETSTHIPENLRVKYPELPWSSIVGLKNIAIHKYFKIDLDIIWNIVKNDIPKTKENITTILEDLKTQINHNEIK